MKLFVVAVGARMPGWVDEAFKEYAKRMPRSMKTELIEVRPEPTPNPNAMRFALDVTLPGTVSFSNAEEAAADPFAAAATLGAAGFQVTSAAP